MTDFDNECYSLPPIHMMLLRVFGPEEYEAQNFTGKNACDLTDRYFSAMDIPFEDLPLYIADKDPIVARIVRWRLEQGE